MKKNLRMMGLAMIAVTCIVMVLFYLSYNAKVSEVYRRNAREAATKLQNIFLKNTVENQIARIKARRIEERDHWARSADQVAAALEACRNLEKGCFLQVFRGFFEGSPWTAVLWEVETGAVLFDPEGLLAGGMSEDAIGSVTADFSVIRRGRYGPFEAFFGFPQAALDERVKVSVAKEIHRSVFAFDSYIWVNEVIDYRGGDNYAIRRVHPNLRDTEGMYLSTSMEDIQGNRPYLKELEGIREKGELFFSYCFKKKNCGDISQKLTYAKLYPDYDWIVAMGIHLDDMEAFIEKANQESGQISARLSAAFLLLLVALLAFSQVLLLLWGRWFHGRARRALEAEANEDVLTGALTRRAAERALAREFSAFRRGAAGPVVMLFDVDHFKDVNDSYGHEGGDVVLRGIVQSLKGTLRHTDSVYRWGGDEFVLLCRGMRTENVEVFSRSLLQEVADVKHVIEGGSVSVTLSMGVSCFGEADQGWNDAIKRADRALYRAKSDGRNQAVVELR